MLDVNEYPSNYHNPAVQPEFMRAEYTTNGSVLKIYFSLQGEEGQEMARAFRWQQ
jgi:hypothetical protein